MFEYLPNTRGSLLTIGSSQRTGAAPALPVDVQRHPRLVERPDDEVPGARHEGVGRQGLPGSVVDDEPQFAGLLVVVGEEVAAVSLLVDLFTIVAPTGVASGFIQKKATLSECGACKPGLSGISAYPVRPSNCTAWDMPAAGVIGAATLPGIRFPSPSPSSSKVAISASDKQRRKMRNSSSMPWNICRTPPSYMNPPTMNGLVLSLSEISADECSLPTFTPFIHIVYVSSRCVTTAWFH